MRFFGGLFSSVFVRLLANETVNTIEKTRDAKYNENMGVARWPVI